MWKLKFVMGSSNLTVREKNEDKAEVIGPCPCDGGISLIWDWQSLSDTYYSLHWHWPCNHPLTINPHECSEDIYSGGTYEWMWWWWHERHETAVTTSITTSSRVWPGQVGWADSDRLIRAVVPGCLPVSAHVVLCSCCCLVLWVLWPQGAVKGGMMVQLHQTELLHSPGWTRGDKWP